MRRSVIVGVDRSARSRTAASWAAREAVRRGLPLKVVHVSALSPDELAELWPYRPVPLPGGVVAELAGRHPELDIEGVRLTGPTTRSLLDLSTSSDLLILGTRGADGFAGLALGSTALGAAEACRCPVILVPSGLALRRAESRPEVVTLGINAREPVEAAVDFVFDAAMRANVRLRALHAWALPTPAAAWMPFPLPEKDRARWEDEEERLLADALRPWREKYPRVRVLQDVVLHSPSDALVRASARAELIVVGRHGTKLGPAANALVHHTQRPVAVVPG
ncbi:universal stress protein [Streptomyces sp. NBC_01381]|uniref:universal stress protein n=1 Tax=Streptomyces sp. NBC_01381 TaxID=2903845 RepID=UPI002255D4EC|nr:universal stress protein [Streptomyces sp. NBC_01381]MCX4673683.1 universal stress protein [Streptomyces sp. NBC_01381]